MHDSGETPLPVEEYVTSQRNDQQQWRIASLIGLVFYVINSLLHAEYVFGSAQIIIVLVLGAVTIATLAALVMLFQPACKLIRQRIQLLVPVGIVFGLDAFIGMMSLVPGLATLLTNASTSSILGLSINLSCSSLLYIAIWTCYAAWQTDLILQAITTDDPLLLNPLDSIRKYWLRAFTSLFIGVAVMMGVMIPILAICAVAMPLGLILIAALGIVWNVMTAALLPTVLFSDKSIVHSIIEGLRNSLQNVGRWWMQLGVQLILLGIFVFVAGNFTSTIRTTDPTTGRVSVNRRSKSTTSFQVNSFWVGGYEHNTRLYSYSRKQFEAGLLPLAGEAIGALMLLLAIAMKITVMRELYKFNSKPQATVTGLL